MSASRIPAALQRRWTRPAPYPLPDARCACRPRVSGRPCRTPADAGRRETANGSRSPGCTRSGRADRWRRAARPRAGAAGRDRMVRSSSCASSPMMLASSPICILADLAHAAAVFVTEGQMVEQVLDRLDAELRNCAARRGPTSFTYCTGRAEPRQRSREVTDAGSIRRGRFRARAQPEPRPAPAGTGTGRPAHARPLGRVLEPFKDSQSASSCVRRRPVGNPTA